MMFDIHLSDDELNRLNHGGLIILTFPDGIRIIVKKDIEVNK